jgi:replication factor A1
MAQLQKRPAIFVKVQELKPGTSGHNLILKVVSSNLVVEKTRSDGTKLRIAECLVGDQTGCIILTARNEQLDIVKPGKTIIVRNSKIDMFKGFMRLAVDKWGKIESTKDEPFEVNQNNNLSTVEYELVTANE